MSLRKYASYKDSGIAWLGKVPAHWEVKPLKYLSRINKSVLSESTDPDYEFDYVDIGSVSPELGIAKTERMKFASAPSRARRLVQEGDVIVSTVRTYLRAIAPIKGRAENLVVSTGFCVVSPRDELKSAYCSYLLQSTFFVETVVAQSVGVSYPATNASDIANIKIPLPTAKEQQKIAAFLDKETAQIDALIDEQTRLISLLREKRQAVISNAITKGLNPNATMKDSGIEWIGKVPAHWTVTFIKRRYEITLGKMLKSNQTEPDETEEPYLRTVNIHWRGIDTSDVKRMWFTDYEKQKLKLCKNDLLVCEGGDVGRSALWNDEIEDCYIQNSINRIRAREDADTRFLFYWLYFIKHIGYIDMICNKATIAHFTVEKVGATPCVYPPLEEQEEIADYLDRETKQIDALIEECEMAIGLLKERRTALISAAVTGAIDVRNVG